MQAHRTKRARTGLWRIVGLAGLVAAVLGMVGCASAPPRPGPRAMALPVDSQPPAGAEPVVVAPAQPRPSRAEARAEPAPRAPGKAAEAQARPVVPAQAAAPADAQPEATAVLPAESRADEARSPMPDDGVPEVGVASWYGGFFHGRRTAMGERFDMHRMTAAHKTMPLPSFALVRHQATGKEVVVRVNDRGPYIAGRIIDLSRAAARELGIDGIGRVEVHRLARDDLRVQAWHEQSRAQAQNQKAATATRPRAAKSAKPRAAASR